MKHFALATVIALLLLASLWLTAPLSLAGGGSPTSCATTYRVHRGDTLSAIAQRFGISIQRLANANDIENPDHIRAGQTLCIPARRAPTPRPTPTPSPCTDAAIPLTATTALSDEIAVASPFTQPHSSFDLVAAYRFCPSADPSASGVTLGKDGQAGKRVSFPLLSGDVISSFTTPEEVENASIISSTTGSSPFFWVARSRQQEPFTYTLVLIGDPAPLRDLQLGYSKPLTQVFTLTDGDNACPANAQPVSVLRGQGVASVDLHAELVGDNGAFVPVTLDAIDYYPSIAQAERCYNFPAFALHPTLNPATQGYQLFVVINDGVAGPPGPGWRARCQVWARSVSWWSRWLRAFWGCSRR